MYLIKGHWQLAGGHGVIDTEAAIRDMRAWTEAGVVTFDCADIYTGVEELIGAFRARYPQIPVVVNTKCVPDLDRLATLQPEHLDAIVDRSRSRLGMPQLDLVQLHWWDYAQGDFVAALQHLQHLRAKGWMRSVGVTNFGLRELKQVAAAGIQLSSHQLQYSLLDRRPSRAMADWCARQGVALLCYGALAGGFLSERWLDTPEPTEPLENRSLTKYKLIIDEAGGWGPFQALLRALAVIAARHGTGIGTVAVRWVLDQPGVHAVIVGARSSTRLDATTRALTLALDAEDRDRITAALAAMHVPPGDVYELERDRNGPHGRIMRYNLNSIT